MDGLKKKDKKSKSKKTKATQWATDSLTWPWVLGLYCRREWERPCCSARISSHLTQGHQEHCSSNQWLFWYYAVVFHGKLSSLAVQCHRWSGTEAGDEAGQLFWISTSSKTAVSPLEPIPWTTMISCHLFNCPYLCCIYSWPLSCAVMFEINRIPRVFNFLVNRFFFFNH